MARPSGSPGQSGGIEIGVILARPRQGELQQSADGRRGQQERDGEPQADAAANEVGQMEQKRDEAEGGEEAGHAGDHVGQRHDFEVLVADVADLMGDHADELPQRQAAHQPVGHRDGGVFRPADGEGVHHPARHII